MSTEQLTESPKKVRAPAMVLKILEERKKVPVPQFKRPSKGTVGKVVLGLVLFHYLSWALGTIYQLGEQNRDTTNNVSSKVDTISTTVDEILSKQPAEKSLDEQGRPLNFNETAPYAPPTSREILQKRLTTMTSLIEELKRGARFREGQHFEAELRRIKTGLRTAKAFITKDAFTNGEEPIELSTDISDDWYQTQVNRSEPLWTACSRVRKQELRQQMGSITFDTLLKSSQQEVNLHRDLSVPETLVATSTPTQITDTYPISLYGPADSTASINNGFYYSSGDNLYAFAKDTGKTESIWCPGKGPMQIAVSDTYLWVRRDKLYVMKHSDFRWRVFENPDLPMAPFCRDSQNPSLISLGRKDGEVVTYIHRYLEDGKLKETILLEEPLRLITGESYELICSNSDSSKLILIQSSKDLTERHVDVIDMSKGLILFSDPLKIRKTTTVTKYDRQEES